jgi:hypothetical protein
MQSVSKQLQEESKNRSQIKENLEVAMANVERNLTKSIDSFQKVLFLIQERLDLDQKNL